MKKIMNVRKIILLIFLSTLAINVALSKKSLRSTKTYNDYHQSQGLPQKKYAVLIGNSETNITENTLTSAAVDTKIIQNALIQYAGYLPANIKIFNNVTSQQLREGVQSFAAQVPSDSKVFFFFTGFGTHLNKKDYIAGIDVQNESDTQKLISKMDIYNLFTSKGSKVFAFWQVNRPKIKDSYFGVEIPKTGSIAQMQGTRASGNIITKVSGNTTMGLFANAIAEALKDFNTKDVMIERFGWQVFNRMRGSANPKLGAGLRQTPTIPVLTGMSKIETF